MKCIWKLVCKLWNEFLHPLRMAWGYYKGYWYFRFIINVIVLIIFLAVLAQNTKDTNDFAKWAFTFLDEWSMVLAAAATLLLAGAAFWAIMDNRHGRIVDRRERLLNEIIKWAMDITRCGFGGEITQRALVLENQLLNYQDLLIHSEYIENIATAKEFGEALHTTVLETTSSLENVIETTQQHRNNPEDKSIDAMLEEYEEVLLKSARTLIEEATKIKVRDIS